MFSASYQLLQTKWMASILRDLTPLEFVRYKVEHIKVSNHALPSVQQSADAVAAWAHHSHVAVLHHVKVEHGLLDCWAIVALHWHLVNVERFAGRLNKLVDAELQRSLLNQLLLITCHEQPVLFARKIADELLSHQVPEADTHIALVELLAILKVRPSPTKSNLCTYERFSLAHFERLFEFCL